MQRLAQSGASSELVAAATGYGDVFVFWMDTGFHGVFLTFNSDAATGTHRQGGELSMNWYSGATLVLAAAECRYHRNFGIDSKG
jgi:hypothetical protein